MQLHLIYINFVNTKICSINFFNMPCRWMDHVRLVTNKDTLANDEKLSWAAYHACCSEEEASSHRKSLSCLLPLFHEYSKSIEMLRHGMDIMKKTVDFLNPGQVPIINADQPLYAVCKQIECRWPRFYGEDCFVVILGGLHIEMNALKLH